MVDLYMTNEHLVEGSKLQSSFVRDEFQYLIDYFYTAKKVSIESLRTEVDVFHNNQPWYSRFALRFGIKKIPPRIRAFEQELLDRT